VIVLDTNVISEAMRGPQNNRAVRSWLLSLVDPPVTTVVNRAEVLGGIAVLPPGRRQEELRRVAGAVLSGLRVCLPLTPECAERYADILAIRRRSGRPIGGMDALIAAIVLESGGQLATRDTADFEGLGLDLVNPWETDPRLS
jgi:predicted nucleic acid-binding protein